MLRPAALVGIGSAMASCRLVLRRRRYSIEALRFVESMKPLSLSRGYLVAFGQKTKYGVGIQLGPKTGRTKDTEWSIRAGEGGVPISTRIECSRYLTGSFSTLRYVVRKS